MKLWILLALGIAIANHSYANEGCIKGVTKIDMCTKAKELSSEIASQLPMKMSQNMSWESVASFDTTT